jgi:3-phosphoglycerate kinase
MYEKIKRLKDFSFSGKKVVMRADFNVPFDKKTREITSAKRIEAALPTIRYILDNGAASLVLMSHLGKPEKLAKEGKEYKQSQSLDIVADQLSKLLGTDVSLVKDYFENSPKPGSRVSLLENTRFYYQMEQAKDDASREKFAKILASYGEIFINDAFGTAHRKEASVYDIAKFLPSGIGFLIDKEIAELSKLLVNPAKPYIALLGGAKVEDKIEVIKALSEKVDYILIMGAMEFAFEKAKGLNVGNSLCEGVEIAKQALSSDYASKIILPVDTVIAKKEGDNFTDIRTVAAGSIPEGYAGLDIGPKTVDLITAKCKAAKTILWNGPAGLFEVPPFEKGTYAIVHALAKLGNTRIVGGGDSAAVVEETGLDSKFTHVSTGGGASLEYIQYGRLPALDILENKK